MKPYVHLSTETYHPERRALNGDIPCVRLEDCNVLVVSLGAPREKCERIARSLTGFLSGESDEVARAMRAALHQDLNQFDTLHRIGLLTEAQANDCARFARAAIAQAEAAGIVEAAD